MRLKDTAFQPIQGLKAARFSGMPTFKHLPHSAGGDHLVSFPILWSLGRNDAVGMIHFDAHTDMDDAYFGNRKYTHGTPFRRAIEHSFLDPTRTIQIGIRGVKYETSDFDWALDQGARIVEIKELFERRKWCAH